jgi:hypothetical protein
MYRLGIVSIAAALTALVVGHGTASAQGIGVQIYVSPPGYAVDYDYPPPVYGGPVHGYSAPDYAYDRYARQQRYYHYRGGCGTYRYWDGDRCVDARFVPPY